MGSFSCGKLLSFALNFLWHYGHSFLALKSHLDSVHWRLLGCNKSTMELLTSKSLKYLKVPFRINRWFHFHPYQWTEIVSGDIVTTTGESEKKLGRAHWYLNVLINIVHYAFVQFRCIQVNLDPSRSIVERVYMLYVTVCYFSFVMTHVHYIRTRADIAGFLRSYLTFLRRCQVSQACTGPVQLKWSAQCANFMGFVQYCLLGNFTFMIGLSVLRPWSPELVSSVLGANNGHALPWGHRMAFGLLQAYIIMSNLESLTFWVSFMLIFVFTAVDLTSVIRWRLEGSGRSLHEIHRIPSGIFKMYRCLHLNVEEFSRMLMPVFGLNHVVIVLISIFCAYGTVRLHGVLAVGLGFVGANTTILLIVIMNMLANLNRKSKKTLDAIQWRATEGIFSARRGRGDRYSAWLRRELRCMHELKIRIGSVFFYDKPIVLTTLQIILQISINLLLMY